MVVLIVPSASRKQAQSVSSLLNLLWETRRCRLTLDASATSSCSPSATTYCCSATDGFGGEVKNQNKKVFFDKILHKYIRFLPRIGVLCDCLWRCHLCWHAGQDVMSSHVFRYPIGAQRGCRSYGAIGHSEGAIKPSWGYREFLWEVWGSEPPCLALLCPLLTPTAAFYSSPSCCRQEPLW